MRPIVIQFVMLRTTCLFFSLLKFYFFLQIVRAIKITKAFHSYTHSKETQTLAQKN